MYLASAHITLSERSLKKYRVIVKSFFTWIRFIKVKGRINGKENVGYVGKET